MPVPAYRVPFVVDRSEAPARYRIINQSEERLEGLRVTLLGSGVMLPITSTRLPSRATLGIVVRGNDLSRSSVLVVRWFRPNGEEYLWRVSF